jgi:hypothetical protein
MDFINLPSHPLTMDEPPPSEMVKGAEGNVGYTWILTNTERAHISDMLDVDSELDIQSN